jgi:hypothetical protein
MDIPSMLTFLDSLRSDIEAGSLDEMQTYIFSEFFLKYKFFEALRAKPAGDPSDDQGSSTLSTRDAMKWEMQFSENDLIKFLSLGWFVYFTLSTKLHDAVDTVDAVDDVDTVDDVDAVDGVSGPAQMVRRD